MVENTACYDRCKRKVQKQARAVKKKKLCGYKLNSAGLEKKDKKYLGARDFREWREMVFLDWRQRVMDRWFGA